MFEWLKNLFGDQNKRELEKLWPVVEEINEHYDELQDLTDDELRAKTDEFRAEIQEAVADIEARQEEIEKRLRRAPAPQAPVGGDGQMADADVEPLPLAERDALYDEYDELEEEWQDTVEDILWDLLPEAFAVIKETCRRMLGETWRAGGSQVEWEMVPYDVQLLGAVVLHQGRIAEMKTGEGKTLAAVMPLYLNALAGRGCHLVTVNEYLAKRDTEWMGPIYRFHGLTVDCVNRYDPHTQGRKEAYEADITYGTNNEFGFDYLRDNSFVVRPEQLMQRDHHFAIIDEIDSVLIDEARTPLIISGPVPDQENDQYRALRDPVEKLVNAQRKLVRSLVKEAKEHIEKKEEAEEAGNSREAQRHEDEAGLALLRASRGYPKNRQLQKLLNEPGMERLRQQTENFYLQENAKRMPEVDEELYFSVDEKKQSIEMTEKGQEYIAKVMGETAEMFVLPVVGDQVAGLEEEHQEKIKQLEQDLQERDDLSKEEREEKYISDKRELEKELQEEKREVYNAYSERAERVHAIEQLLKAFTLYERDTEYIVEEGKVQIVDEHTGRVMEGRRYSEGLHEALEAKEEVEIQNATQTYATITLQNYFRMYDKLSGMTGTAETEAEEFGEIYDLDVVVVPTHEPVRREDKDDLVFQTKREKFNAVIEKVKEYNDRGQPVLVGSASVEVSETISRMLQREGIRHNVLNAKQDRAKKEADIIAEAGQKGAVTIATNMAGRGTDIKISDEVRELGGLAILGSERHESRRIDLQLRGRAGRQGDPGESQFYVSLEDELMRLFGSDRVAKVMDSMGIEEGEVITHPWINKSIKRAQSKVEQNNFAIRKRQLEYDDVLNSQREVIYKRRREALTGERFHGQVLNMLHEFIEAVVERHYGQGNLAGLQEDLLRYLAFEPEMDREEFVQLGEEGVVEHVYDLATDYYTQKRESIAQPFYQTLSDLKRERGDDMIERVFVDFTDGQDLIRAVADVDEALETNGQEINEALERTAMLQTIDEKWTEHLRELDELKEGIGLRSFGRKDPVVEYKMEAFDLFADMMADIGREVVSTVFRAGPVVDDEVQTEGEGPKGRLDARSAQTQHDSAQPDYSINAQGGEGQQQGAAERDPTTEHQEPVTVADEPGRNEYVTVRNNANGETTEMKWKYAKKKIKQGWTLVS
ncbi:preprotein translocase subunit SecA [Salinibacter sp. 10B]|uniref:preprotein translocase subunit SecA n=1 Tax=Salinibacter sp. 10B TaxID=1923971 RepID=UPI000CF57CF8|nr:preprotein translocase subunit SecA [Salinibacter sp. 10B]PQJ34676.1 preprotein translocase subunit SecA [Salinibacter sp. 10B]